MKAQTRNVLVGIFVLGALVALGILIIQFGESQTMLGKKYLVNARFSTVVGVQEGTEVLLAGVPIGRVQSIHFVAPEDPTQGVEIDMYINRGVLIPLSWTAHVDSPLMGQSRVLIRRPRQQSTTAPETTPLAFCATDGTAIIMGTVGTPLEKVLPPEFVDTLQATVDQIRILAKTLTPAAEAVTALLEERSIEHVDGETPDAAVANLSTAVQRLDIVLTDLHTVLGDSENQTNLKDMLANLATASTRVNDVLVSMQDFTNEARGTAQNANQVLETMQATLADSKEDIRTITRNLAVSSATLSEALDHLVAAGQQVSAGDGTLGMLLRDSKFYEELVSTTQRLGLAADELIVLIKQLQEKGLLAGG